MTGRRRKPGASPPVQAIEPIALGPLVIGREVLVFGVAYHSDSFVLHLKIVPGIPEEVIESRRRAEYTFDLELADDVGTRYVSWDGGFMPDATESIGHRSFRPLPPAGVVSLMIFGSARLGGVRSTALLDLPARP